MRHALLGLVIGSALSLAASPAEARQHCTLSPIGTADVAVVLDGRTLQLSDGRVLRLAAIEVAEQSRSALHALVAGHTLHLAKLGPERDRYGRLVAFAFAGDAKISVQQALLAEGAARVSAHVGNKACAGELLAAEGQARAGRLGLWADPNFAPLPAESSMRLEGERGRFALVEGKVLSVRESGGTIYVNFGRRWAEGFSVIILRRNQHIFAAAGLAPSQLTGRRVRVRGWIEQRRGPVIEADAPEQIELIGATAGQ
jgi:endonuclease YncB( thermonuclease family)